MKAPLNGKHLGASPPPDPRAMVAEAVFDRLAEDGEAWADLTEEERAGFVDIADHYLSAHAAWLTGNGYRVLPPGATPRPHTEAEAYAMIQAAKDWFEAQKRKGKLMMGPASGQKLILPPGRH